MALIDRFGQVMLYVEDIEKTAEFWTKKVGFTVINDQRAQQSFPFIEIAPSPQSDTSLVLFPREEVQKAEPELNFGTPSILFSSYNLQQTYAAFQQQGITTGPLVHMQGMQTFNFADNEGRYFAIREIKQKA